MGKKVILAVLILLMLFCLCFSVVACLGAGAIGFIQDGQRSVPVYPDEPYATPTWAPDMDSALAGPGSGL